ncbi:hypothetical protein O3P69_017508 [Scylla paramamosain]|uniref:Uncharacterized protein n=1 Tax=Scylla paramamosain TaxID=85552 RepID=A0AAW0TVZ1_SCYPA
MLEPISHLFQEGVLYIDCHVLTASASTATPCWRQTQPDACVTCDTLVFPEISMNGLGQHHQGGVWTPPLLLAAALAPQRNVFYRLLPSRRGAEASSKRLFKVRLCTGVAHRTATNFDHDP